MYTTKRNGVHPAKHTEVPEGVTAREGGGGGTDRKHQTDSCSLL